MSIDFLDKLEVYEAVLREAEQMIARCTGVIKLTVLDTFADEGLQRPVQDVMYSGNTLPLTSDLKSLQDRRNTAFNEVVEAWKAIPDDHRRRFVKPVFLTYAHR